MELRKRGGRWKEAEKESDNKNEEKTLKSYIHIQRESSPKEKFLLRIETGN